ncbi:rhomboid family intramembrane serine protease [Ferruginibacter lapsinanis]|uniref:rhomboid family intramembrane serine protease n=1 Tax=Ferruginibacter lapsinanis TaxID=563172 RepID=UPI001E56052D|nr:rhomboid family intramembrane serine protease [Ferruginibacter lapsinanis]UEG50837.1 rhomboid family intramembrane serine protease [Ferruginibacter lapsinanis]
MAYRSPGNSFQKTTPIVLNLIIINVLVFLLQLFLDGDDYRITENLVLFPYNSGLFKPYQLVTCMFAHGSIMHILFNMFTLYTFGVWLERVWGPKKFLIFYLVCGLAAGIAQMLLVKDAPSLGASGAIMGVFAAFAYLFPNTELMMFFIPVPIKAKYMVFIMAGIDLFGGFHPGGTDNIGHFAHLGGLVMGFILVLIWNKTNRKTFY